MLFIKYNHWKANNNQQPPKNTANTPKTPDNHTGEELGEKELHQPSMGPSPKTQISRTIDIQMIHYSEN